DGFTLNHLRTQQPNGILHWHELAPLVRQLCEALAYAHREKVIHRDLKPANLMLTSSGVMKLADFGIAAQLSDSLTRITGHRPSSGTPAYMSPQQMRGGAPQITDDVYSLGAILYELLTGKPPFFR